jgi:hypothetical protein
MSNKTKKIKIFDKQKKYSESIKEIIFDPAISTKYKKLETYLNKENYSYNPKELEFLIKYVQKSIFNQTNFFCHLIHYIMELSGNWGDAGEQQSKTTFCRCLLRIPPEQALTHEDASNFLSKLDENILNLGIKNLTIETARSTLKNFSFKVLDRSFGYDKVEEVNKYIRFIGSSLFLQGGQYGEYPAYILGEGSEKMLGGFDIITITKEWVRSPNAITSMAALIGNRSIYIRNESLRTVFQQKWLPVLNNGHKNRSIINSDIYHQISEGIKKITLSLYNTKKAEDLEKIRPQVIKDMHETILFHELGHGTIQQDVLNMEDSAILETSGVYGENVLTSLLELMADCAPSWNKLRGPLLNLSEISKKDPQRAKRMFFMYLSDTWFFDTDDEYMYIYSELIVLVLLRYIKPGLNIDFDRIAKDTSYNPNRKKSEKATALEKMQALASKSAQDLHQIVKSTTFDFGENKRDYPYVKKLTLKLFKENKTPFDDTSYKFHTTYWRCMLKYVKSLGDKGPEIERYLKKQEEQIQKNLIIFSCGTKKALEYNYNTKKYITDKLKELGIVDHK